MNENKRFTIFGEWHKDRVIDEIRDNTGEYLTIGRVVDLLNENEQLKQQIKDLRLEVLDSLHDADDIQCSCNPCVVEECVKRVVE